MKIEGNSVAQLYLASLNREFMEIAKVHIDHAVANEHLSYSRKEIIDYLLKTIAKIMLKAAEEVNAK